MHKLSDNLSYPYPYRYPYPLYMKQGSHCKERAETIKSKAP